MGTCCKVWQWAYLRQDPCYYTLLLPSIVQAQSRTSCTSHLQLDKIAVIDLLWCYLWHSHLWNAMAIEAPAVLKHVIAEAVRGFYFFLVFLEFFSSDWFIPKLETCSILAITLNYNYSLHILPNDLLPAWLCQPDSASAIQFQIDEHTFQCKGCPGQHWRLHTFESGCRPEFLFLYLPHFNCCCSICKWPDEESALLPEEPNQVTPTNQLLNGWACHDYLDDKREVT